MLHKYKNKLRINLKFLNITKAYPVEATKSLLESNFSYLINADFPSKQK